MANTNVAEDMRRAIAEGRVAQCTAISKKTGERCSRAARKGYAVCSAHGAGTSKREKLGIRRAAGRPIIHGLYSKKLTPELQGTYEEVFGDLSLVQEVALVKTLLYRYLAKMEQELQQAECDPEDAENINGVEIHTSIKKEKADLHNLIKMIEAVTKTTVAAFEQLKGKKVVVSIQNTQADIVENVKEMVAQEIEFMIGLLCPECRQRVADALSEKQQTVLEG